MINQITIRNFQSHEKTDITFHSGVNAIIGTSDSGKTAVLRALNWVVNNRPVGESFRSVWGGDTKVSVVLTDCIITRERTDKKNVYRLTGNNNDDVYEAVKTEVPDDIKRIINFSDINIQYQMDSPFLLSETAGEVTKYLDQVVSDLHKIDPTMSSLESKRRKLASSITAEQEMINSKTRELEKYSNLDEIESKIVEVEKAISQLTKIESDYKTLHSLLETINENEPKLNKLMKVIIFENLVDETTDSILLLKEKKAGAAFLRNSISDIQQNKETIQTIDKKVFWEQQVEEVGTLIKYMEKIKSNMISLSEFIATISSQQELDVELTFDLSKLEKEWHELMPDTCPLCEK